MLIHPEIKQVIKDLVPTAIESTTRESPTALSFDTAEGKFISLVYGHEQLEQYKSSTNSKLLDTDASKMRFHSVKAGMFHITKEDIKPLLIFLCEVQPDIFVSGNVFDVFEDVIKALMLPTGGADLAVQFPNLTLAKKPDGSFYVDEILQQFKSIFSHPLRDSFEHIYYVRGVRKWGIFINFEGAKYSLFF